MPIPASVPLPVARLLSGALVVGFSGSRTLSPVCLSAFRLLVPLVPAGSLVATGCARGLDAAARTAFPSAVVYRASAHGRGAWAYARRSSACVQSVAASGGLWCSFPSGPCPSGLVPSRSSSRCFNGSGSGSWASLALALGLGLPCVVFLPAGVKPPPAFGLTRAGGGWFVAPGRSQMGLF